MIPSRSVTQRNVSRRKTLILALLAGTSLSPLVSFSRASAGTAISSAGELVTLAANRPRWQHDGANTVNGPIGLVNHIRNPRAEVSPGAIPANWNSWAVAGVERELLGPVTVDGIPGWAVRLRASGPASVEFSPAGTTDIDAAPGESVCAAIYACILSGPVENASLFRFGVTGRNSTGGALTGAATQNYTLTNKPQRLTRSQVLVSDSAIAKAQPRGFLEITGPTDITVFVGGAQYYRGTITDTGALILPPPGMIGAWTEQHYVNGFRNPRGEGGVVGPLASGGALPPEVTIIGARTLSLSYAGQGVEDGLPYMAIRIHGLAASNSSWVIGLAGTQTIPAANGEDWTCAYHAKLAAGTLNGITLANTVRFRNSDGFHQQNHDVAITPTNAPLISQRQSMTLRAAMSSIAYVTGGIRVAEINGQMVDCTIHIGVPGLFKLGYDPGFTPLPPVGQPGRSGNLRVVGLLNEEQRTNLLNNPRGEGSVSGSVPTNWIFPGSTSVVANPVVDGVPCTDMRFNHGAAVTESAGNIGGTAVSVTPGTTISFSFYLQGLPSNNSSPLTRLLFWARLARSDGSFLASGGDVVRLTQFSALPTNLTRYTLSFQVPANAAFAMFRYSLDTNAAADISFRVGAPQIELGSTASTPILPPAGSPGISTRAEDVLAVPRSMLPTDLSRGTLVAKWRTDYTPVGNHLNIFTLAEASQSRRYAGFVLAGGSAVAGRGGIAGTHNLPNTTTTINRDGTLNRYAFTWSPENAGHALNGGAALFNAANSMFGVDPGDGLRLFGAAQSISAQPCVIESITFQPTNANAAGLQALSA